MANGFLNTEDVNFVRDRGSNAILNTDTAGYKRFLLERQRELQTKKLAEDVRSMQAEISDIKNLLQQLVNGLK